MQGSMLLRDSKVLNLIFLEIKYFLQCKRVATLSHVQLKY